MSEQSISEQVVNKKNIFKYIGASISFCIGAGFATGQEVLQYFTAYGWYGFGSMAIGLAIYIFLFYAFFSTGYKTQMIHSRPVFNYYLGIKLGFAYEIFVTVLLFVMVTAMLAGTGAIFQEHFKISGTIGRIIMYILVGGTVIMGFNRLLAILAPLGPIISISCIAVAIVALTNNVGGLSTVREFVEITPIIKVSEYWWFSGILVGLLIAFPSTSFMTSMGAGATSHKEAVIGGVLSAIAYFVGVFFTYLAQLANLELLWDKEIPTLVLARNLVPFVGDLFAIILLAGIYTTVSPTLWAFVEKFAEDHTKKYFMITIGACICSFIISYLPYSKLINIIFPLVGYLSIGLFIGMIIKHIKLKSKDV